MNELALNPFTDEYVKAEIAWFGAKDYQKGKISVKNTPIIGRCDDFLNVNYRDDKNMVCPLFRIDGHIWMSLTPMEIESQYRHIQNAKGFVAILGLGMGYATLSIAQKENVASVVVYEKNEDVVAYFEEVCAGRKGYEKIRIVVGDVRDTLVGQKHDFVYADIYHSMAEDAMLDDYVHFTKNNNIGKYQFWSEELMWFHAVKIGAIESDDLPQDIQEYFEMYDVTEKSELRMNYSDRAFTEKFLELKK